MDPDKVPNPPGERRTRSCAECRRRRIRCDGSSVPCSQCVYYQVEDRCYYPQRRARRAPTVKAYEELCSANTTSQLVLERLFPGQDVDALQNLSRDELLRIVTVEAASTPSTDDGHLAATTLAASSESPTASIPGFEPSRIQEFIWDETTERAHQNSPWEDDVNGMRALFDTESGRSYLGISSVPSILHVMAHTSPQLRQAVHEKKRDNEMSLFLPRDMDSAAGHPVMDKTSLIDAYFRTIHIIMPMVDEIEFRQCHSQGTTDKARGSWLALLNMVLALGYISLNNDDQAGHATFAHRASEHMGISCFAVGHLHTLQALILFGGYYLHFLNKPNMASAVMGAAHRMALAMGLHQSAPSKGSATSRDQRMVETRTRTWWCLFCLDTWAGTTLGRPLFGIGGPASVPTPVVVSHEVFDYQKISMSANVSFSMIAARIQDRMAQTPLVPPIELERLDSELRSWHENLHPILREGRHCPETIRLASLVLRYRYMNMRMLLHRPFLLIQAIKAGTADDMSESQVTDPLANTCCWLAKETIDLITGNWYPNQVLAWNSSWFVFQACLVILLRLLSPSISTEEHEVFENTVTEALNLLTEMCPWRVSAGQTHDLILFIFSARATSHQSWDSSWSLSDDQLMDLLGFESILGDGNWHTSLGTVN